MENTEYNFFAEKCVDELKVLQDKFQKDYDLSWYENWFYEQVTGLLTFSTNETELNFKFFEIGTFSKNSNTWMWAWHNEDILDNIKEKSFEIRNFGNKSKFPKLSNGHFVSNETEAWEFAAISAKLTNAIGVYRLVDEHLLVFLVLTEFVDKDKAQKIKDKFINCETHDTERIAFVCGHLNKHTKVGFEESFETFQNMELGEDDEFQAWCSECEIERQKTNGWNETSMAFAEIKLVCEKCYFEMKAVNV